MQGRSDHNKNKSTKPIRLEPIEDLPPKPTKSDDSWEPQKEPLTLAPEEPLSEDPVLADMEKFRVPNSTQYRCAHCNYILAGLTSRRCPECGEPFTIDSAMLRGMDPGMEIEQLNAVVRWDTIKFCLGAFFVLAGFLIANVAGSTSARAGMLSFHGVAMIILSITVLAFATFYRQSGDYKWSDVLLICGLVILASGVMIAFF